MSDRVPAGQLEQIMRRLEALEKENRELKATREPSVPVRVEIPLPDAEEIVDRLMEEKPEPVCLDDEPSDLPTFQVDVQYNYGAGPCFGSLPPIKARDVHEADAIAREAARAHFEARKIKSWQVKIRPA